MAQNLLPERNSRGCPLYRDSIPLMYIVHTGTCTLYSQMSNKPIWGSIGSADFLIGPHNCCWLGQVGTDKSFKASNFLPTTSPCDLILNQATCMPNTNWPTCIENQCRCSSGALCVRSLCDQICNVSVVVMCLAHTCK